MRTIDQREVKVGAMVSEWDTRKCSVDVKVFMLASMVGIIYVTLCTYLVVLGREMAVVVNQGS